MLLFFKCFLLFLSSIVTLFMKNASTEAATKKNELFWTLLVFLCMFIDFFFDHDFNTNTSLGVHSWLLVRRL